MRIVSLASGSAANAYCVESGGDVLLVDCGLSCRELVRRCTLARIDPARIVAAVFTHNHSDHVKGAGTFHSKFPHVPLYANFMTADAIAASTGVDPGDFAIFENGQPFSAGAFEVRAFSIPHDVPDPVGYTIEAEGLVYFHATDVGAPLDSVGFHLSLADAATLEFNHDPQMLAASSREESLKRRIRGPRGHLSNPDAARLVKDFATNRLSFLALAHLSRECNAPHLALAAAREAVSAAGLASVELLALSQDETASWTLESRRTP